jgi:integrase
MKTLPESRPIRTPTGSSSAHGLPGPTALDAERVAAALEAEIAASTRIVYASAWRRWESWCGARGFPSLPCRPEALAAYLAERAEDGLSYASIDLTCCAISYRHRQHGLIDPTTDPTLRRVRRGLRRLVGAAPRRQAHPLDVAELAQIVTAIDPGTPHGLRDRAIILLGYASAVRPSELAAFHLADIVARPDGLLITIRRSKTDQDGLGQMIGVVRGARPLTDPVSALRAWLNVRPRGDGPLFTRLDAHGTATFTPIGARTVSRMLQARGRAAGLGHLPITGHSLRAGHATRGCKRRGHRPHRSADQTPRPRDPGRALHPTHRRARDVDQSRPRTLMQGGTSDHWRATTARVDGQTRRSDAPGVYMPAAHKGPIAAHHAGCRMSSFRAATNSIWAAM